MSICISTHNEIKSSKSGVIYLKTKQNESKKQREKTKNKTKQNKKQSKTKKQNKTKQNKKQTNKQTKQNKQKNGENPIFKTFIAKLWIVAYFSRKISAMLYDVIIRNAFVDCTPLGMCG